jgi:isopropylmalate/homocitrate/citramalate synthase
MPERLIVEVFDTTLRDGAQSLPEDHQFPDGSKVILAERIVAQGIDTIEAGFPASMGDAEEVAEVAATVGQTEYRVTPKTIENGELVSREPRLWTPVITGLARAVPAEIEQTWAAVQGAKHPGIHVFVATAEEHMRAKHPGKTQEQILDMAIDGTRYAREISGPEARVEFSCEAASTSDMATLERFVRSALQEDINVINLPDTLGAASPIKMRRMFEAATRWLIEEGRDEDVIISSHNHNDGERAVQNTIESAHAVIDTALGLDKPIPRFQVEVTSGHNLGERNGNTNLAPLVRDFLTDRDEFGAEVEVNVDTLLLKEVVEFVCAQAGLQLDPNAAAVGRDTKAHRSGVHADAIIKGGAAVYAAVNPVWFGHKSAAVVEDGKYQGRAGKANLGATNVYRAETVFSSDDIRQRIDFMGLQVDDDQLENITVATNTLGKQANRPVADTEIEQMVAAEQGFLDTIIDTINPSETRFVSKDSVDDYEPDEHTAEISVNINGWMMSSAGQSPNGAIAAGVQAVNQLLELGNSPKIMPARVHLPKFSGGDIEKWQGVSLEVAQKSESAAGIFVHAVYNGRRITAYAEGTSVDDASVTAYIKAVNLVRRIQQRAATDTSATII